jgi:hypothetical protein
LRAPAGRSLTTYRRHIARAEQQLNTSCRIGTYVAAIAYELALATLADWLQGCIRLQLRERDDVFRTAYVHGASGTFPERWGAVESSRS